MEALKQCSYLDSKTEYHKKSWISYTSNLRNMYDAKESELQDNWSYVSPSKLCVRCEPFWES